ncbi:MAG: substrate-binding domain-containing protein [Opitutaceae bacterium]|nr:substrate-binding domain-containing protein [Opitutaceae bacterium]
MHTQSEIRNAISRRFQVLAVATSVLALTVGAAFAAGDPAATAPGETRDAMELQAARNAAVAARGRKAYYPPKFDLSGLPSYVPRQKLSGQMRMWGSNYLNDSQLKNYWDAGFRKYHPDVKIEYYLPTGVTAVPGLITGQADLGANTHMWQWERVEFEQVLGYAPLDIEMVTGSFNVAGWNAANGVFVHKSNPIAQISMEQLDGIFGAERSGGWIGTTWHPELARGPEKNIRTWGQLGLTGAWADKPINIYTLNLRYHTMEEISDAIIKGSDKWNENARMYSNVVRADGKIVASFDLVIEGLSQDPYGIAITGIQTLTPDVKCLALSRKTGEPAVPLTLETVQDLTYPFAMPNYWTVDRKPGQPLNPIVKEFLTYTLSREGQEEVMRDGKFLPITAEAARKQLRILEETTPAPELHSQLPKRGRHVVVPYTQKWDLSALPRYQAAQPVTGTIRIWGMPQLNEGKLGQYWQEGFRQYHPKATIEYHLQSSLSATSAIITGVADIGASPRLRFSKLLGFQRLFLDHDPLEIPMFTGSYNLPGWADAQGVFVHQDNPLSRLTMKQLDRIFGTMRDGGWIGTTWHTEYPYARGAEENIRTWGQLGLTGEWASQPIHVYGLQARYGTSIFLSDRILHGGDKWNDKMKVYANMVKPDGSTIDAATQLMADLSMDRYGIGFSGIEYRTPQTKCLELAANESGPYVALNIENVQNRTYPLAREPYWYINRMPNQPVEPRIKEFLKYVLSQEGQQEVVRDGKFLPLTAEKAKAALLLLE